MSGWLQRELSVAFSRNGQPIWVRVIKWAVIVAAFIFLRDRPHFWSWVGGVLVFSAVLHLFYRWKTRSWTRSWGGWNDLDATR